MVAVVALAACGTTEAGLDHATPSSDQHNPDATYWVYVGAESADYVHRIRFGPDGAEVENQFFVSERWSEIDGPHGLAIDDDGEYMYVTTGHGFPDGKLWKVELGPDEIVGGPVELGRFPATVDVTPDGEYAFIVNFNLHGEMVPSSISVVYTPEMMEIARPVVGVMPHGSRISPNGRYQYSGIMMDDDLVEINTRTFEENRRFNVAVGEEGPIDAGPYAHMPDASPSESSAEPSHDHEREMHHHHEEPTCSPTWAQPSADGDHVYVACNANDTVLEINTEEWALSRTFETGSGPYNIDVTPDGELLIVTLKDGDGVEFVDLEEGETVAQRQSSTTITHGVITSPDSKYAFVSVEGVGDESGKVDIYELESFERVADVEVRQQASGIDFWKMESPE